MSKPSGADDESAIAPKEAHALLVTARPAAILAALKHPDFAMVAAVTFAGFRVDANGLANPIVRRRLADEAVRNADFAAKLRELAAAAPAPAPPRPAGAPPAGPAGAPSPVAQNAPDLSTEKYRAERDRLKREAVDEADRRRAAERDLAAAKMSELTAVTAGAESERESVRLRQRAERLERKVRRLEIENAQLRRAIGTGTAAVHEAAAAHESGDTAHAAHPAVVDTENQFVTAVRHLLDRQKWPTARALAEDVLRSAPTDEAALAIHAAAAEAMGDGREAISDLRRLVSAQIARGDMTAAARTLAALVSKSSGAVESKTAREFFTALGSGDSNAAVRDLFDALQLSAPQTYQALRELARGDAVALFSPRSAVQATPDRPLPIVLPPGLPVSVTGRRIAAWLDANETPIVDALRKTIQHLDDGALSALAASLSAATGGCGACYRLLTARTLAGPAVVDASNVAWHGQDMAASPKARLRQVIGVRRALRDMGYFPILLIADANLPHIVDDPASARKMIAAGEIVLATSRTDADELILHEAKRLNAPVVSNDYMVEWDPKQEVTKLQFSVAPASGAVTIYR